MFRTKHGAAVAITFFIVGAALSLSLCLYRAHHRTPTPAGTDLPPMGWTEVCHYAALGDVCHTYPPGDPRSEPTPPPAPFRVWASLNTQTDN